MKCFSFRYTNCASHPNEKRCSNWSGWKMTGDIWLCADGFFKPDNVLCKCAKCCLDIFLLDKRIVDDVKLFLFFPLWHRCGYIFVKNGSFSLLLFLSLCLLAFVPFDIHWHIDTILRKMLWICDKCMAFQSQYNTTQWFRKWSLRDITSSQFPLDSALIVVLDPNSSWSMLLTIITNKNIGVASWYVLFFFTQIYINNINVHN